MYDSRGATDSRVDPNGVDRAVSGTGSAFHAGISVDDGGLLMLYGEHLMRADLKASAAADADSFTKFQGCNILQVSETLHVDLLLL